MGAYPNLKPIYPLLLLRTSWSSITCSDHSPFVIQTLGIPNHVDWATSSGYTKASTCIFAPRALNVSKQVATLNQPINCHIILQNGTMTSYMAQPRHPLNNQVLAIFFPSSIYQQRHTIQNLLISILHSMISYHFHCVLWLTSHFHILYQSHSQFNPMDTNIPEPTVRILVAPLPSSLPPSHSPDLGCIRAQRIVQRIVPGLILS